MYQTLRYMTLIESFSSIIVKCSYYSSIIKFRYLWYLQTFVIACLLRILLNCCVRLRKWRTLMDEDAFNYSTLKKLLKDHCYFCSMVVWIMHRSGSSSFIYVQDASCSCLFCEEELCYYSARMVYCRKIRVGKRMYKPL